jgi:hypothetical protein
MKTQIIQSAPEESPAQEPAEAPTEPERKETWLRRGFLAAGVIGYFVVGVIHPPDIKVGDDTTLYLWLHHLQPVLILLLAWGVWLLVKDLAGRAAQVARVAIVPFAIAYSAFDAVAGIATGMIIREANSFTPAEGAVVQQIWDDADGVTDAISIGVFAAGGLSWFVMALAAAIAVKQIGGLGPTLLMAIGAAIFAVGHPFPPGPIGIALFGLGVAWLELRRSHAAVPEATPVLAP